MKREKNTRPTKAKRIFTYILLYVKLYREFKGGKEDKYTQQTKSKTSFAYRGVSSFLYPEKVCGNIEKQPTMPNPKYNQDKLFLIF